MKELDGLSGTAPLPKAEKEVKDPIEAIHDPNKDREVLVEWSVDPVLRNEAIREVYDVLLAGEQAHLKESVMNDDITEADIPAFRRSRDK
jgi:hypothetical protein